MVLGRSPSIREVIPKPIRSRIPKRVRAKLLPKYVSARDFLVDPLEYWLAKLQGELTPSRDMIRLGGHGGNLTTFRLEGRRQLRYCVDLGDLKPNGAMLEVGSGMGRLAAALTRYLNKTGKYEGLDVNKAGVGWCQKVITPRFPNFRFHLVDVFNSGYNPSGKTKQSEYEFPCGSGSFDLVYSYSVFTHMILDDIAQYLSEMSRVLKTDGICINTFLLLNAESLRLIQTGQSSFDPKFQLGLSRFAEKDLPESTIAHDEAEVRSAYSSTGLQIIEPVRYGRWPGREKCLNGQDIIIARKRCRGLN
jgi:SAM-dependent methyltransferase